MAAVQPRRRSSSGCQSSKVEWPPYEDSPELTAVTINYRPKPKKGYFYAVELSAVTKLHIDEKKDLDV